MSGTGIHDHEGARADFKGGLVALVQTKSGFAVARGTDWKGAYTESTRRAGKLKGCGMSKGNTCPNCGQPKFQPKSKKSKSIYECTNPNCRAVGWLGFPKGVGSGKGAECPRCRQKTKRVILSDKRLRIKIRFCTNTDCRAISIRQLKKR